MHTHTNRTEQSSTAKHRTSSLKGRELGIPGSLILRPVVGFFFASLRCLRWCSATFPRMSIKNNGKKTIGKPCENRISRLSVRTIDLTDGGGSFKRANKSGGRGVWKPSQRHAEGTMIGLTVVLIVVAASTRPNAHHASNEDQHSTVITAVTPDHHDDVNTYL